MNIRNTAIAALLVAVVAVAHAQPELVSAQGPDPDQDSREDLQQVDSTPVASSLLDWSGIAQSIATVVAIVIGGYLAWRNWHLFRSREPHVNVSHEISHRFIGSEYVHIAVTATLHNSSRVNVEFRDGSFTLQQIAPASDEDINDLYTQVFNDKVQTYLQWTTLEDVRRDWGEDELVVEPGESETETYEFIVSRDVESVVITTYFYNSRVLGKIPDDTELRDAQRRKHKVWQWREVRGPRGWSRTTVYDIMVGNHRLNPVADEGQVPDDGQEENNNP